MPELQHYAITDGHWTIVAEYIGEGWDGEYNEEDTEDEPLMRYDFFRKGEEEAVDSYCTAVSIKDDRAVKGLAHLFLDALHGHTEFQKREVEGLTWTRTEEAARAFATFSPELIANRENRLPEGVP